MHYIVRESKELVAHLLAQKVIELIMSNGNKITNIALSGGSTPFIMFDVWANEYKHEVNWGLVHFYWVDERCVPPTDDESNYKNTKASLFDLIDIPEENIHRVLGENDPKEEALRYSQLIESKVELEGGFPKFDIILLGMGDDGHTASIFPHQMGLMEAKNAVVQAQNPYSKQNRISLSGKVINNAEHLYFLVTGANKSTVVDEIFNKKKDYKKYPSAHISTKAIWYLDQDAAAILDN